MATYALPSGWTARDLRAVEALARSYNTDPRDLLALWNSESGLYPRIDKAGYYGLIMGREEFVSPSIGTSWIALVKAGSVTDQIAAIKRFWDRSVQANLGESAIARAKKLRVKPVTVLYSLNFVPAYFAKMTSADQPMVIKNGGPDRGVFYHDNPGFDTAQKGFITVRDIEARIDRMRAAGSRDARTGPLFASVSGGTWPWTKLVASTAIVGGALVMLGSLFKQK